ncbi:MAG: hypothetical protein IT569_03035 [Leptospiraceae bacterium]|nr:hypothetical protein [Leptospiraceae bacterium]
MKRIKTLSKVSLILLLGLVAINCKNKKSDDSSILALVAISSGRSGDCQVTTSGKTTFTFVTDLTSTSTSSTGTISSIGTIPVVIHENAALKIKVNSIGTAVKITGKAYGIVYESSSCPLTTASSIGSSYTLTGNYSDSNSEFTSSHKIDGTSTLTFTKTGTFYYFFYAIPSKGQSAKVTYTVTGS